MNAEDLSKPNLFFQIGVEPSRIDILTSVSGVDFEVAWKNRAKNELDGLRLPIIGREELIANKLACGRPKDIADAVALDPKILGKLR